VTDPLDAYSIWLQSIRPKGHRAFDKALTECAAVDETIVFLNCFKDLHDPRHHGKVCYPLEEILLLSLLAVVAGAETITEARSLAGMMVISPAF
jgi:DDE_Tnp_1-associated